MTQLLPAQDNPYERALKAYREKNFPLYLSSTQQLVSRNPNQPEFLYQLAGAYALNQRPAEAFRALHRLAAMGLAYPVQTDSDFVALRSAPQFPRLLKAFAGNDLPTHPGTQAFEIAQPDLIPEGMAYDPGKHRFFVGSIYRHKIVQVDSLGRATDFTDSGQDGLQDVLGMKVDSVRNQLWVCSYAGQDFPATKGRADLFQYDLNTGRLLRQYALHQLGVTHLLNDVIITRSGEVYVTDSEYGAVYRVQPGSDSLQCWLGPRQWFYPNGLTLSPDEQYLFVAHFGGIARVSLRTKQHRELTGPANFPLTGVDGLYFHGNSLIGVQNGVSPLRVVRMQLNPALERVVRGEVLEAGHPLFDVPTTGALKGNEFYFLANSHLRNLDGEGRVRDPKKLRPVSVLRVPLR